MVLVVGFVAGLAWGVNARLWMGFISDDPEFTLFLVVYAGLILAAGFSLAPQRDGWRAPPPARVAGVVALAAASALVVLMVVGLEA